MQVGVFAKTFSGRDPATVLSAARAAGFDTVQYNMACSGLSSLPLEIADDVADAVVAAAAECGIRVGAVSATYNMIHPMTERLEHGRRAAEAIAASARRMGAGVVTLCTGSADPLDQWRYHPDNSSWRSWRLLMREFEFLIPLAERHDLVLGVEPEMGNVVSSAHLARTLLDTLRSERVGIVVDPANLVEPADIERGRNNIREAIDLLGDRIIMAHAKDRKADGSFAAAGKGIIDFDEFISDLRSVGFNGPIVAHGCDDAEAPGVAAFLRGRLNEAALVA
ncbi:MAG: sugar phosphate isomerase/epimerase [Gammaproteobacteria bacterium]|nr:sugar phosphate isomerase/epimerase [Gammaproteobacteria bacterium]